MDTSNLIPPTNGGESLCIVVYRAAMKQMRQLRLEALLRHATLLSYRYIEYDTLDTPHTRCAPDEKIAPRL